MSPSAQKAKGWLVGIAVLCGIWLIQNGPGGQVMPPQPSSAQAFAAGPQLQPGSPVAEPLDPSDPVRIRIPAIEVDAPMTPLGLTADGSLDVPPDEDRNLAGWYEDGVPPGARGTAIVAGHVDNAQGPSVFYALGALAKGPGSRWTAGTGTRPCSRSTPSRSTTTTTSPTSASTATRRTPRCG